jgi:hypothetical protein
MDQPEQLLRPRGKILFYHGVSDRWFSAYDTLHYSQGEKNGLAWAKASRLYIVPGMGHCGAGNAFAQFNLLSAVVDWVETVKAPAAVRSTRTPPSLPLDQSALGQTTHIISGEIRRRRKALPTMRRRADCPPPETPDSFRSREEDSDNTFRPFSKIRLLPPDFSCIAPPAQPDPWEMQADRSTAPASRRDVILCRLGNHAERWPDRAIRNPTITEEAAARTRTGLREWWSSLSE